jgi:flagellar hook-associated protein 2
MVTTTASSSSANLTNALGAGSGIDIKSLAKSLVDAEKAPRKAAIDKGVTNNEKVVSGMAAVKYALTNLQVAFDNLKDKSDFKTLSLSNSQSSAFTATASTAADAGSHTVLISALAAAQRNTGTTAYAATSTAINGGAAITLTLGGTGFSGGDTITVAAGNDTPAGVVAAINGAGKGLSAQLVNTGDATSPYKVVVTGSTGSSNAFTISSSAAGINFDTALQLASDASLTVDGIAISSTSNTLSEAIPGVTLNLLATNTSAASLNLRNDTSGAKTKVLALVTAYNDTLSLLDELTNPKSTLETYGATLSGNSTVTNLRSQLRALVTADSSTAASSGTLAALRDIGVEVDKAGKLTSNSVKLDLALDLNFVNTTTLLSGNQENQGSFDLTASGLAGDASRAIITLLSKSGTIATESANATTRISKYQDDLVKLEDRMTRVLARYNKQFATMDSLVGQTKSTQTGLTSSFAGLMAMYTNK